MHLDSRKSSSHSVHVRKAQLLFAIVEVTSLALNMIPKIAFFVLFGTLWHQMEALDKSSMIAAPISQIQWHYKSIQYDQDYEKQSKLFDSDYMKIKPKSYQLYHYNALVPKPKSLHISLEPGLGDTMKVNVKDTLLDAIQQIKGDHLKQTTTVKPKRPNSTTKRPRPQAKPLKLSAIKQDASFPELDQNQQVSVESSTASPTSTTQLRPQNNNLAGQSQIGNRESQMVIKPTVIVNIRGTVSNSDSEIKLESRSNDAENVTRAPQTVFNINQEVNIDRTYTMLDDEGDWKMPLTKKKQNIHTEESQQTGKVGKNMELNDVNLGTNSVREKVYVFQFGPLGGFINV